MFKPALLNIVSFPEAALVCGIYNLIILAALNYSSHPSIYSSMQVLFKVKVIMDYFDTTYFQQ